MLSLMQTMYLNLHKLTLSQFLSMGLDIKFKINLHHEHFSEALEKYTRFPKLLSFSVTVINILMER